MSRIKRFSHNINKMENNIPTLEDFASYCKLDLGICNEEAILDLWKTTKERICSKGNRQYWKKYIDCFICILNLNPRAKILFTKRLSSPELHLHIAMENILNQEFITAEDINK